jgi:agmatinase
MCASTKNKKVFLDFPQTPLADASYAVLPVEYDATVTYASGTRRGPSAVIAASAEVELFDEELKQSLDGLKIHTLDAIGDNADSPEKTVEKVEKTVEAILPGFPLVLGGEHSVSVGAVRAALRRFPKLTVLYFDAHADLRDEFEGSAFNHACAARRMLGDGARLVQVGIRSLDEEQYEFIKKTPEKKLKVFWASDLAQEAWGQDFHEPHFETSVREIANAVGSGGRDAAVWVSFDLDAFDPSEMPSVGTPEPGGLRWREVLRILRAVFSSKANVVGADVVELCPREGAHASDFAAARLSAKILAYKEFLNSNEKKG